MKNLDQFSVYLYGWGRKPPDLKDLVGIARHLDKLGFYSVGFPYHMTLPPGAMFQDFPSKYLLDPLAVLPALAATTKNIRVGIHSLILPLLPPYFWAKYLASLDVLSGGRLIPGMCIGWNEGDFRSVGADLKRRARSTDEQLEVITRLWTQDGVTHKGRFYELNNVTLDPKPLQKPYPPIWYGGGLAALPRASKYARYILPPPEPVQVVQKEWAPRLKEENRCNGGHIELALMNFVAITEDKAVLEAEFIPQLRKCIRLTAQGIKPEDMALCGTPEKCARRIREFQEAGVSHFLLDFSYRGGASLQHLRRQVDLFVKQVVPLV